MEDWDEDYPLFSILKRIMKEVFCYNLCRINVCTKKKFLSEPKRARANYVGSSKSNVLVIVGTKECKRERERETESVRRERV